MPAHSSHILQPLDVVCFSPLKQKYSQRVRDLARHHVWHIDKERFLPAFRDAFRDVFTSNNCKKAFEAAGLVPIDAQRVIDRLDVRLHTPPQEALPETPWQSKTPSNSYEFGSQSKLVKDSFVRSLTTAQESFSKLIKGAEEMLHKNVLIEARVRELEEQLAEVTKRRGRKRKRIQTGGTLDFGAGASQAAKNTAASRTVSKKASGEGRQEKAQPGQRRCGTCGETGHNARTCQKEVEEDSLSDTSESYEASIASVE